MQFFPILQGLERIRTFADKPKGDGWAQGKGVIRSKGYTLLYRQVAAAWGEVLCARRTRWYEWDGKRKNIRLYSPVKKTTRCGLKHVEMLKNSPFRACFCISIKKIFGWLIVLSKFY